VTARVIGRTYGLVKGRCLDEGDGMSQQPVSESVLTNHYRYATLSQVSRRCRHPVGYPIRPAATLLCVP